jgi:hypothetical protein
MSETTQNKPQTTQTTPHGGNQLPPIEDDLIVWDVAFFAQRHALSTDAIGYHMRHVWGTVRKGQRRRLTYDQALRFDRYIQRARHTPKNREARCQ